MNLAGRTNAWSKVLVDLLLLVEVGPLEPKDKAARRYTQLLERNRERQKNLYNGRPEWYSSPSKVVAAHKERSCIGPTQANGEAGPNTEAADCRFAKVANTVAGTPSAMLI